jgi:hypothetical protein
MSIHTTKLVLRREVLQLLVKASAAQKEKPLLKTNPCNGYSCPDVY